MRFRIAAPFLAFALMLLAGCGPALLKPPMPLEGSLLPATFYVSDCPEHVGFIGSRDVAMGQSVCAGMLAALRDSSRRLGGGVNIISYSVGTKDAPKPFEPDKAAEAANGSRYRVILTPAYSYRAYETTAPGARTQATWVEASQPFAIEDVVTGKRGRATVPATPGALPGSTLAANAIVEGMRGPRCEALNKFSIRAPMKAMQIGKCATFALSDDTDEDDEDEDEAKAPAAPATGRAPAN